MKNVFSKSAFLKAPGGDRYEWKNAETHFKISKTGLYVIVIAAKAKNAKQNKSNDDDDLRIALDGFHFGKYEKRKDKISWKGFGTSASFDGASLKGGTDGDNLKIVVNGKTLKNPVIPNSKKYQNFYFSGDINQSGILTIGNEAMAQPLAFENSVELWYDQEPKINNLQIDYYDAEAFLEKYKDFDFSDDVLSAAWMAIYFFKFFDKPYSAKFLQHALQKNPKNLIFKSNHPIAKKIKADPVYFKIADKVNERIAAGILDGELWPKDFDDNQIYFDSDDLATALHGIIKIEYLAKKLKNGHMKVNLKIFDVYDFEIQINLKYLL